MNKLGYSNLSKEDFTEINNTIKKQFTIKEIELFNLYPLICSDIKEECEVIDDKFKKISMIMVILHYQVVNILEKN